MFISGAIDNHRRIVGRDWVVTLAGERFLVGLREEGGRTIVSFGDGPSVSVASDWLPGRRHAEFTVDNDVLGVQTAPAATGFRLRWSGMGVVAHVRTPRIAELALLMSEKLPPDRSKMLLCPMPGVITAVTVKAGDQVEAGQALATVEGHEDGKCPARRAQGDRPAHCRGSGRQPCRRRTHHGIRVRMGQWPTA